MSRDPVEGWSAIACVRALGGHPGHRHTSTLGATVEAEPRLPLPPAQNLLLTRAFGVVEEDGGSRSEAVFEGRQSGIAGQTVTNGVSRWAVHHQQVDGIALQGFA